jgi:hypothetical protein
MSCGVAADFALMENHADRDGEKVLDPVAHLAGEHLLLVQCQVQAVLASPQYGGILSSAVFITNIAEYDFRYTQDVVWRLERLGAASDSSS